MVLHLIIPHAPTTWRWRQWLQWNAYLVNCRAGLPQTFREVARTLAHAQIQSASTQRTHTTLTPPTGNLFTTRSLSDGCSGDGQQGHNKSHLQFSSVAPSAGTKPLSVCAAVPRALARERGGEGTRFGGEGVIVPPPTSPRGSDLRQTAGSVVNTLTVRYSAFLIWKVRGSSPLRNWWQTQRWCEVPSPIRRDVSSCKVSTVVVPLASKRREVPADRG